MNTTVLITALSLTIVSSAAIGVAHKQGWGSFGEFESGITEIDNSCKAKVQAVGWSNGSGSHSVAETRALVNWSKQAMRHGQNFSSWHNARSRDVTCKNTSGKTTKCTVVGLPCEISAEADLNSLF